MGWFQSFFGADGRNPKAEGSAIDVVSYAASLASSPQSVDPLLDELRAVTANIGPEGKLSESDQQKLADTYLRIEAYLIKEEKLRSFSLEEIRGKVKQKFSKLDPEETLFWTRTGIVAN